MNSQRSSLESLMELEQLLEEQHKQLIEKGFIPADQQWISADLPQTPTMLRDAQL